MNGMDNPSLKSLPKQNACPDKDFLLHSQFENTLCNAL